MSLTIIQRDILATIKANRSPESYLAGGSVLNRAWPRLSDDLDIFSDLGEETVNQAKADIVLLNAKGYKVSVEVMQYALVVAEVRSGSQTCMIEWMDETRKRFFPIQQDDLFGWRLHDADLVVNKVIAGASRCKVRDAVDLARIHTDYLPLGYWAWAAAAKTPLTPVDILERIVKNATLCSVEEYGEVRALEPVDGRQVLLTLMLARDEGIRLIESLPFETYGHLFLKQGEPCAPTLSEVESGNVHVWPVSDRGAWPQFPDQPYRPTIARRP